MANDANIARKRSEASLEDLKRLLSRLDPEPVRAWQAFAHLRLALLTYFRNNRCRDCERLADETLDRIAKKPDTYEIMNIGDFAFGVARNVRREAEREAALQRELTDPKEEEPPSGAPRPEELIVNRIDMKKKLVCLRKCLAALPFEETQLFQQYYSEESAKPEEYRQRLAGTLGVSWTTLRMRVSRIRKKLENCFTKCERSSLQLSGRSGFDHRK